MDCIYCGGSTKVTNSRVNTRSFKVWRRRKCVSCNNLFSTYETINYPDSIVIHEGNSLPKAFNRDILLISLYRSCGHRKSPLSDASELTDTVISQLLVLSRPSGQLDRLTVIETVSKILKRFDKAAYVQYSAYHPL